MPAPNKKNIADWFGDYFRKWGGHVDSIASEMERHIKNAGTRKEVDHALNYVDDMIHGHGVEAIRGDYHVDNYYYDIVGLYVNTGDTYNATLVYDTDREKFVLTTMGDWVEKNERKYKIQ